MRIPSASQSLSTPKLKYRLLSLTSGDVLAPNKTDKFLSEEADWESAPNVHQSIYLFASDSLPDFESITPTKRKKSSKPKLDSNCSKKSYVRNSRTPNAPNTQNLSLVLSVEKANLLDSSLNRSQYLKSASSESPERVKSMRSGEMSSSRGDDKSESMTRYDRDAEFEAYLDEKRALSDRLHDHWKKDLNQHKLPKGAPLNKINDKVYKSNQWITIVDNSNETKSGSDRISNLVDTFTGEFDDDTSVSRAKKYQVNGQVGVMIAQKLQGGEKLRVGRNGEEVSGNVRGGEDSDFFRDVKKEDFKMREEPPKSILSWKEQVKIENVKIIEPKISGEKLEQKTKPERTLIVKKLIEEEEFLPELRKKPIVIDLKHTTNLEVVGSSPPHSNQSQRSRNPVEIIGIRPGTAAVKTINNDIGGGGAHSTPSNQFYEDDLDEPDEIRIEKPKLVKRRKNPNTGVNKLGEALDDGCNYNRIIDSLTDRLANSGDSKPSTKNIKVGKTANLQKTKSMRPLEKRNLAREDSDSFSNSFNRNRTTMPTNSRQSNRSRPSTSNIVQFEQIPAPPPQSSQSHGHQAHTQRPITSQNNLQSYGGGYYFVNTAKPQTASLLSGRKIGLANKLDQSKKFNPQAVVTNYFNMVKQMPPSNRGAGLMVPIEFFSSETNSKESNWMRNNAHFPSTPLTGSRF